MAGVIGAMVLWLVYPDLEHYRWDVKTASDREARLLAAQQPVFTEIAKLRSIVHPARRLPDDRRYSAERQLWRVRGTLIEYQLAPDRDIHLKLQNEAGARLTAEIPDPEFVAASSPFRDAIIASRSAFLRRFPHPTVIPRRCDTKVEVVGPGFFDRRLVGTGRGVEIHPVIRIEFPSE